MSTVPLNDVSRGDPLRASEWNTLVGQVRTLRKLTGANGVKINQHAGGTTISLEFPVPRLHLCRLNQAITEHEVNADGFVLQRDYNAGVSQRQVNDNQSDPLEHIFDPVGTVHLDGTDGFTWWMPNAGQRVFFPFMNWHLGKVHTGETITAGSSGLVNLDTIDDVSGVRTATGITVTAWGYLLVSGQSLTAGTTVAIAQHPQSRLWIIIAAACP